MDLTMKQTEDAGMRTKLRLSEVERLIRKHRILIPPPSRPTLIGLCEDGTFETAGGKVTKFGWLVYEDSFWAWARSLDEN
jgi:hypothetical protein